jgi:hypothetical protein
MRAEGKGDADMVVEPRGEKHTRAPRPIEVRECTEMHLEKAALLTPMQSTVRTRYMK